MSLKGKPRINLANDDEKQDIPTTTAAGTMSNLKVQSVKVSISNQARVKTPSAEASQDKPVQLKMQRGPDVKIRIDTKKIMAEMKEKMTMGQQLAKMGTKGKSAAPPKPQSKKSR